MNEYKQMVAAIAQKEESCFQHVLDKLYSKLNITEPTFNSSLAHYQQDPVKNEQIVEISREAKQSMLKLKR